ncbi:MAG: hypothetical protein CMN30_27565 [Sandaracinus sp.]|nr:hypothetical protein [Sandaracinus sp.]
MRAEGVAAIVGAPTPRQGAQVVLLSDVDLRARMRLAGQRTGEIHLGPLPAPLLVATLDELLGEALIAREAERVQLASPTDRDVRDERRRLEGLAGGAARLTSLTDALGVDDEEIDAMARRRAMVKVFLEANLQGAATIDDAQIDRIYQSGEHPFQGQELEDVREPMRVWLTRRALENSVRRWVEVLRARTTIRVLAPYGGNR